MIDKTGFERDMDALRAKMRAKLGVRGKTFAATLRRAGRLMSKPARQAGNVLVTAAASMDHPQLRARVDAVQVQAAFSQVHAHLDTVDRADRRKGMILGMAGGLVFNLILIVAALIGFLWWRGLLS